jgi:hypothetical protein
MDRGSGPSNLPEEDAEAAEEATGALDHTTL